MPGILLYNLKTTDQIEIFKNLDLVDFYDFVSFNLELIIWEVKEKEKIFKRFYKMKKIYKYPRKEKIKNYRRHGKYSYYCDHETKWVRKATIRKFRRLLKSKIYDEVYYRPINHDYKTYGWLTW